MCVQVNGLNVLNVSSCNFQNASYETDCVDFLIEIISKN